MCYLHHRNNHCRHPHSATVLLLLISPRIFASPVIAPFQCRLSKHCITSCGTTSCGTTSCGHHKLWASHSCGIAVALRPGAIAITSYDATSQSHHTTRRHLLTPHLALSLFAFAPTLFLVRSSSVLSSLSPLILLQMSPFALCPLCFVCFVCVCVLCVCFPSLSHLSCLACPYFPPSSP